MDAPRRRRKEQNAPEPPSARARITASTTFFSSIPAGILIPFLIAFCRTSSSVARRSAVYLAFSMTSRTRATCPWFSKLSLAPTRSFSYSACFRSHGDGYASSNEPLWFFSHFIRSSIAAARRSSTPSPSLRGAVGLAATVVASPSPPPFYTSERRGGVERRQKRS